MAFRQIFRRYAAQGKRGAARTLQLFRGRGLSEIRFWLVALIIGIVAGFAALGFRLGVGYMQALIYGADDVSLTSHVTGLAWYWVLGIPIVGGMIVGLILQKYTPDCRAQSLAHVIEGAAVGRGRVTGRAGLASAFASMITLSTGGSTGREGPVVHLGALISSKVSRLLDADGITARDLLGCAVAAAVSASFNAPIAGTLFALEVILRHYAVHAFAPIVIASVAGTLVSRLEFGDITEFTLPEHTLEFYAELPAFLILGLICGLVAVVMMKSIFWAEDMGDRLQEQIHMPSWMRPACAGAILGMIALAFPHIIGVGYETTSKALTGNLLLWNAIIFAFVKVVAVAVTIAGRMGGGIFSPSLMLGSLTGLAFGLIATAIFPSISGTETLYALAGMGAMAAAVLGAPISTTLIVFELTGDWQTGLVVMVAVSTATALASQMVDKSFFLTQLERRNVHLAAGPQAYLLATFNVATLMRTVDAQSSPSAAACWELVEQGFYLDGNATLEQAMPLFEGVSESGFGAGLGGGIDFIPVITVIGEDQPPELWGALMHVDALKAYNRALAETAAEEHS